MTAVMGEAVSRVDGPAKVTGAAKYAAEFDQPNLAHAALVLSTVTKGRIAEIDTAAAGETSYGDHTPSSGTFYYEVRHIDGDGNPSAFSGVASADVA